MVKQMAYKSKFFQEMERQGKIPAASSASENQNHGNNSQYKSKFFQNGNHLKVSLPQENVAPAPMRATTDRTFTGTEMQPKPTQEQLSVQSQLGEAIRTRNSDTSVGTAANMAKISELQVQEAQLKVEQNAKRVQEVQQQEQRISQQLEKLETTRQGMEKLMADYQATGSDVTYQAYMIAFDDYNKQMEAYNKEYAAYQKNAKVYDDYNASQLRYEKAYAGYEKNYGKYEEEWEKYSKEQERLRHIADLEANLSVEELKRRRSEVDSKIQDIYIDPDYYAKREIYQSAVAEGRLQGEELEALNPDKERARLLAQAEEYTRRIEQKQTEDWVAANKNEIRTAGGEELMADLMELARLQAKAKEDAGQYAASGSTTMDTNASIAATELNGRLKTMYGDRVDRWMEYATWAYEQKDYANKVADQTEIARNAPGLAAVGWTALTSPLQKLVGGTIGLVSVAGQRLEKELTGSATPVNYKNKWTSINAGADEARKIVSERIEKKTAGWAGSDTALGNIYSGAFNLGMSMLDSGVIVGMTALGLPSTVGTALLGGSAASSAMMDAVDKGATADQALFMGIISGLAEAFFEKYSIENLISMQDAKGLSNILKSMLVQGGVEASEEGATTLANTLADMMVMGDLSQLEITKRQYMEDGYSETDAERMATQEWILGLSSDLIGGFLSGFLFGAGGAATNAMAQRSDYRTTGKAVKQTENGIQGLIADGLAADTKSRAYKLAQRLQQKLDAGKQPTALEVGRLMYAEQEAAENGFYAIQEERNEDGDPAYRLVSVGEDGNIRNIGVKNNAQTVEFENGKVLTQKEFVDLYLKSHPKDKKRDAIKAFELELEWNDDGILIPTRHYDNLFFVNDAEGIDQEIEKLNREIDSIRRERDTNKKKYNDARASEQTSEDDIYEIGKDYYNKDYHLRQELLNIEKELSILVEKKKFSGLSEIETKSELAQTERFEEETLQQEVQTEEADQPAAEVNETTTGLTWAGDETSQAEPITAIENEETGLQFAGNENLEGVANNENQQQGYMGTGADQARQRGNAAQRPAGSTKQTRAGDALRIAERAGRIQRDAAARNVRKVSLRSLGLAIGSESNHLRLLPRDFSPEVAEAYELADNAGVTLYLVTGSLRVENNGEEITVDGIYENGVVYARADTPKVDFLKTVKHEIFHSRKDSNPDLVRRLIQFINENYTPEQVQEKSKKYFDAYQDIYKDRGSEEEIEEAVFEELLADAYAEYDRYKNGILPGLSEEAQEQAWAGEEKTTARTEGGVKLSYAGEQAATADMERLRRARELQNHGVDNETIRKETGWFRGMDGMWRFEIDDSQMQYRRAGDAKYAEDPKYMEYNYLWEKAYGYGSAGEAELEKLRELDARYGRIAQLSSINIENGNATLEDILVHDELFENYPQLRKAKLEFSELGDFVNGQYNWMTNTITLSPRLRNAPQDTLIHEIQHAIQKIEGFASGSNPEYWKRRLESGYDNRTHAELAHAENLQRQYDVMEAQDPEFMREAEELYASVPDMPRGEINWDTLEKIEDDPIEWQKFDARRDALEEKYGDKIFDFFTLKENLKSARTGERMASDLYRDTAGEIEARDAAKRRNLTAQQRADTIPDYGNEDTVFADRAGDSFDIVVLDNGNVYVQASRNVIKGNNKKQQRREISNFFNKLLKNNRDIKIGTIEGDILTITKNETANKSRDDYKTIHGKQVKMSDDEFSVKLRVESHIDEVAEVARKINKKQPDNKNHPFAKNGFTYRTAYFKDFDGQYYKITLSIGHNGTVATVYNVGKIEGSVPPSAKIIAVVGSTPLGETLSMNSIDGEKQKVNTRFSKASSEETIRQRAERQIAKGIGDIMSVPASGVRELQNGFVRDLMEDFQQTGELNEEKLEAIAQEAFARGLIIDDEFYQTYKDIKNSLRKTKITISEQDQADIPDFNLFKKRAFGTLRIVKEGGLPVDTFYQELMHEAPNLFDPNITHPADQLMKMYEVARSIRAVEIPLERAQGSQSDQFYEWAAGRIYDLTERVLTKYADSIKWKPTSKQTVTAPAPGSGETDSDYIQPRDSLQFGQQMVGNYINTEPGSGEVGADYIQPEKSGLEWAGQYQMGNWSPDYVPDVEPEENLTEMEKARRGTIREWVKFIASGKMTPEEFAKAMREAPSLQLSETAQKLVDRISEGGGVNRNGTQRPSEDELEIVKQAMQNRQKRLWEKPLSEMTPEELVIPKNAFTSTPAMDKLGIKIDGSVTRYRETAQLKAYHEAAEKTQRILNKRMKELKASEEEEALAKAIAEGSITAEVLNKDNVNIDVVLELADFLTAIKSFNDDRLSQRREEINVANLRLADQMLQDSEDYDPKLPGVFAAMTKVVMNERTPERVVKQIFEEAQGQKIYDMYFRPVWVNGAEMARFENRMKVRVEQFVDQTGKERKLTEIEREFAQRLLEGEAVVERMKTLQENDPDSAQRVKDAVYNINNGMDYEDAIREHNLGGEDREELQGLVQAYSDYMAAVEVTEDMDKTIMQNAIAEYKQIYNELYDAINDFLVSHGYEPMGFIRGYAPHFQKREVQQGLFGALKKLGVEKESVQLLPTSIAGRTADFKPNMKWNPHRLTRKGEKTDYDIQLGFERYLHYAAEMFYHTDDVMRIRQAVNWMRGKFAGEDIKNAIEDAEVDKFKSAEWKLQFMLDKDIINQQERAIYKDQPAKINEMFRGYVESLYEDAKPENLQKYSEFVTWLDNYANIVASKQSLADRGIEYGGGREALNWGSRMMRTFAAANVAGNLSSVLNQSAQLPLIQQQLGKYAEYAMLDLVRGTAAKENFADRSDFLTDKRGVMKLTMGNGERFLSGLFKPAELMDRLVSTLAVRGRYLQALDQGMTPEQALKEADDFGRRVMGSRMKGARPLGFESKTYIQQMLHVFQTEASNTFDYMFLSDMPQAVKMVYKTKGKKAAARYVASAVMGYLLNAFLWNMLTNELYGTTPAPYDLIGWLLNFVASGWEKDDEEYLKSVIDNGWESVYGERPFATEKIDREEGFQWAGAIGDLGYNVLGDLPYVRNVMGIMGWGDQSMPTIGIGEAAKHIKNAGKAMVDEEGGLTWAGAPDAGMELLSAASQLIPMGRQIEKTAYGIKAMIQGGKYSGYGDNKRLQYPIERTPWNWIRAGLFGVSALDETDEFYTGGAALSAGQTQKLLELEELGIDRFTTYDLYQEFREINKDLMGVDASTAKRNAINNLELEDQQKLQLFDVFMLDQTSSNYKKTLGEYQAMLDSGLTWDDVTRAHNTYAVLDEEEMTATKKATEFAVWVDRQGWEEDQKNAVEDRFKYWSMTPAEPGNYNRFEEAGLETEAAKNATDILGNLLPENEKEIVTTNQKVLALQNSKLSPEDKVNAIIAVDPDRRNRFLEAGVPSAAANRIASEIMIAEAENGEEELGYLEKARIAVDNGGNDAAAMDALSAILTEGSYEKLEIAVAYGLRPENWVLFKEEWQAQYGEDSVSQEKVERVLGKMNLTNRERAAIWQTANKSWKPTNNPYNSDVAYAIYNTLN